VNPSAEVEQSEGTMSSEADVSRPLERLVRLTMEVANDS